MSTYSELRRGARAATEARIELTIGKLCLKPGPSGIGSPSQTVHDPGGVQLARDAVDPPAVLGDPARAAEAADRLPAGHARHVVVSVVGAEREHGDLRRAAGDHLAEARVPVVEIGPREPGREPALDADDVDRAAEPLERVARHLGERVAGDPDAQRMRRGERRLRRRGARRGWCVRRGVVGGSGPAGGGSVRCTRESIWSSFSRPIATCSSWRGVVRCSVRLTRTSGRVTSSATRRPKPGCWICACLRSPSASSSAASTSAVAERRSRGRLVSRGGSSRSGSR